MRQTEYTKAFADGVTDDIVKNYKAGIKRGGSYCVEPIYEDLGNGIVKCSTKRTFIPWLDDFSDEMREKWAKSYALRRLGTPQDVANAVVFLASDAAGFITGQTLSASGGYSMM